MPAMFAEPVEHCLLRVDSWPMREGSTLCWEGNSLPVFLWVAPCADEPALVMRFCVQLLLTRGHTTPSS